MRNATFYKYFWGFNERALKETGVILKTPAHPRFNERLITFLSRCDKPKELFSVIQEKNFVSIWPAVRAYWVKIDRESEFRDWWQTIYEQLLQKSISKQKRPQGDPSKVYSGIGRVIKEARIRKGLSQKELALMAAMSQPDISKIEEGKKNITLETLSSLCRVLGIKRIDLEGTA